MKKRKDPSIAFMMPVWGKKSEQFFMRQISMLAEAGMLKLVVLTESKDSKNWGDIPVVSLRERSFLQRALSYLSRRFQYFSYSHSVEEKLKETLRRYQIDTLLIHYGPTAVALKKALDPSRHRIFVHIHGYDTHEQLCPPGYKDELRELSSQLTIICNSNETYQRMMNWDISPKNLVVKYMGVEIPEIVPHENSVFTILSLGRLVDCKSPDRTIQAFELACDRGLKAQLVIAGGGPLLVTCQLLQARSKWKNAIKILGEVTWEEGKKLVSEADMFTQHAMVGELTGQVEAFGVSILEAMASALPVSTCNIGGIREIVVENETSLIFESGNIEQQSETFIRLANHPELRFLLGKNARQRVVDNYSLEREKKNGFWRSWQVDLKIQPIRIRFYQNSV